jgi:YidC/Oxa1 family membrane protein insertase
MQEIAPQIKKLQEKYKDKPDVLQKETMKLYKENNVNPLGGCLPLLLQMPFFFALYSALINSIDLWNASFMLWMKDLSMPDTVAYIAGIQINILPLLMTASTFIQQKQTTVDTGNQQQKILMYMMPILLLFIFWTMPQVWSFTGFYRTYIR